MTYKPDPAAVEAARKINEQCFRDTEFGPAMLNRWAAIIDSTTRVGELREALERLLPLIKECCLAMSERLHDQLVRAESLLARLPKG